MTLPNFLVVGAAKCGTTSVHHYLRQHPEIFVPERKELHYFAYPEMERNSRGPGDAKILPLACGTREAYEACFASAATTAVGEVCPSYFYYLEAARRIQAELDSARIIVLLRCPVQKAFSQYMHLVRANRETMAFPEALLAEPERIARRWSAMWRYAEGSLYADRLERYLRTFGPERVKVLLFQDFVRDPTAVLQEMFEFVGVDPTFRVRPLAARNPGGRPRSRVLADLVVKPNPVVAAARRLLPPRVTDRVKAVLMRINTGKKGTMEPEAAEFLTRFFRRDVARVERLLGRSLETWLGRPPARSVA